MKLLENLYAYIWQGNDNNCNTYLFANVLNHNRHVIIDPGHITTPYYREPGFESVAKEMEKDGLEASAIGLVVLTHSHTDHCEAAKMIRGRNRALVALHEAEEGFYQRSGGTVDFCLQEGELELGKADKMKLNIYHSPGHSPGHITIFWPAEKVLIAGDVVFYRSTGRFDLLGGSIELLRQSIGRLAELDIEYLLCGHPYGHPGILKGKEAIRANFDFVKRSILF